MKRLTYLLFLCLFSPSVVDCSADENGYFMLADFWCAVYSEEREQVEYIIDWYFNKEFTMQYNSTVGNWTGFTPGGLITASLSNGDRHDVLQRILERQLICVNNVDVMFNATEENMAEPSISLQEADPGSGNDTMLVCSAYDFYPKRIKMTWHRNGQEVTEGVTFSDVATNGDWTYHVHSYLEFTPERQDRVSCVVEHATLWKPKFYEWEFPLNSSDKSYLTGGVGALLLGGVFLTLGLIQYRRKSCHFSSTL
ncbi:boLa class II histocompatibility antigen, DQB*0101 beta chain-like [Mugil cephalus]|uniref:boLa class II histocompatibility antigen, DQB*0101 beta chain-like n=1 Tax=Mugil cephalus TaxID=48193 RepID=UPI001FB7DFA2|nr:boLa class II histocompatibility antigen, DQB*0101 beta chain-like [Mugil cephalus]